MMWEATGYCAAILTSFAFVPQIFRCLRMKSARDISPVMVLQFFFGVSLWLIYGVYLNNMVIIVANTITLASLLILLLIFYLYGRKRV